MLGYADDTALIVVAKYLEDAGLYSSEATSAVKAWLESAGLAFSKEKTKAILIIKRNYAWIKIGNCIIASKPAINYLGVMIDGKLNFKQQ